MLFRACACVLLAVCVSAYEPTTGVETESDSVKIYSLKNGEKCALKHADAMGQTEAESPHVRTLRKMYMAADGVSGMDGHIELILGPHSQEELKDGLTAQQEFFDHIIAYCKGDGAKIVVDGADAASLATVLEAFEPTIAEYKMVVQQPEGPSAGCLWHIKCVETLSVDTQVTYTLPLGKVTGEEFGLMPRMATQKTDFDGAVAAAKSFVGNYPQLKDAEIEGLMQILYKFTVQVIRCMDIGDIQCIKNGDGQMVKAELYALYSTLKWPTQTRLKTWWKHNSNMHAKGWREPKQELIGYFMEQINLDRFPNFLELTKETLPGDDDDQKAQNWGVIMSWQAAFVVRHHLIMVFNRESRGAYKSACESNELKALYKDPAGDDETALDRVFCEQIAMAAEPLPSIRTDDGVTYIIVEGRLTAFPFNYAFFPCDVPAGVKGKTAAACKDKANFHVLSGDRKMQWNLLAAMQTPNEEEPDEVDAPLGEAPPPPLQSALLRVTPLEAKAFFSEQPQLLRGKPTPRKNKIKGLSLGPGPGYRSVG